jgi:hypothetical protein
MMMERHTEKVHVVLHFINNTVLVVVLHDTDIISNPFGFLGVFNGNEIVGSRAVDFLFHNTYIMC